MKKLMMVFLLLVGCNEVEDSMPISDEKEIPESLQLTDGVFVINEGNFDWGHGTLSHKKYDSDTVYNEIYKQVNSFEIGNVAQSMTIIGDLGYICVNNSSRVDVIETKTSKWVDRIDLPKSSPRYLLQIDERKSYVTDLYADRFYVVDHNNFSLSKEVKVSGWTEKMCLLDQYVYMTVTRTVFDKRQGGQLLLKINKATDLVEDSLALPYGPIDLQKDKNNKIWILCNGGLDKEDAAIVKVDPKTFTIQDQITFTKDDYLSMPSRLRINNEKDELFYIRKNIYRLPIDNSPLTPELMIEKGKRLFYGLGVSPHNNDIYVTDAIDYVQKGWVFRYSQMGVKLDSFQVGVIPNEIVFQ
ncbi:DUF5074 domain-containing protein [Flammeovirga agarivorans]|uniref:Lipoprotein n=1 Tax=Flammeovirga agarivorans TaxID=2726742 RepID=A0A7X8XXW8_9BACT|nr:DUF5074 domain-containing protein [Flammeovirga agarivorans]NLR93664.1 hypothetical protein [Flammeovirga agarivorans]